ncbi:MAG: 5-(carboxyamino)imidazole ribonucleotide synthase [Bdellovibrionia bacterium]
MDTSRRLKNRVGILGGGQLALMLAHAAARMGMRPVIFAESAEAPAARVHRDVVLGAMDDEAALRHFFSQVDLVVFENEFVDCDLLRAQAQGFDVRFAPDLSVLQLLQDKVSQKRTLKNLGIPTPEFRVLSRSWGQFSREVHQCLQSWKGQCVFKWSRQGYDGKGVLFFSAQDAAQSTQKLEAFFQGAKERGSDIYAEPRVVFQRELAILGVQSQAGQFMTYPLVISEQHQGVCSQVLGPAQAFGVSSELQTQAHDWAQKLAQKTGLKGVFALEFFESAQGKLWVNEIAPRVHNSGHYTQNACSTDQFENHLRAVWGMSLGEVHVHPCFGMINLLGPESWAGPLEPVFWPKLAPQMNLHWYGKLESRPGRKLGHLNATASSPQQMLQTIQILRQWQARWLKTLAPQKKATLAQKTRVVSPKKEPHILPEGRVKKKINKGSSIL